MHIHTFRSNCGEPEMKPEAIFERAAASGLEIIGLSDHIDTASADELARAGANRRDLERLRPPLTVLVGAEVTMLSPRRAAITPEQAATLDFVMIAANHYHLSAIVEQPPGDSPQAVAQHALAMMQGAVESGIADIIAHPLVAKTAVFGFDPWAVIAQFTPERLAPVLRAAAARGTAMELNPLLVARFPEFYALFIAACKQHGVRFALGTDAHHLAAIPYAENGVYRGAGPAHVAALGVAQSDLLDPLSLLERRRG